MCLHLPRGIPVQVEAGRTEAASTTLGHLAVVFTRRRSRTKNKTVLAILKAVDDNLEAVEIRQICVPTAIGDDQTGGVAIETDHSDKQRVCRISHANLSARRCWHALIGLNLLEICAGGNALPQRVFQH